MTESIENVSSIDVENEQVVSKSSTLITLKDYEELNLEEKDKWKLLSAELKKQIGDYNKQGKSKLFNFQDLSSIMTSEEMEFLSNAPNYAKLKQKLNLMTKIQMRINKSLPEVESLFLNLLTDIEIILGNYKEFLIDNDSEPLIIETE